MTEALVELLKAMGVLAIFAALAYGAKVAQALF